MKKLFVSVPMKGFTEFEIDVMQNSLIEEAKNRFPEEFEVIQTRMKPEGEHKSDSLWCLGRSLQLLSDADYYVGIAKWECGELLPRPTDCKVETMCWIYYLRGRNFESQFTYNLGELQDIVDSYCKDRAIPSFSVFR